MDLAPQARLNKGISSRINLYFVSLILTVATLCAYAPVLQNQFVSYDDPQYVTANSHIANGFTVEDFQWAFTSTYQANWHPLTWLSHLLDIELFGLDPGRHHLVNLLLHTANTLLLFHFLRKATSAVWRSAAVAALFALHPMHVESVAWVSERKDVLSTFLMLLTLLAYLRYVKIPSTKTYALVIVVYVLGLMAKPMLVTLPFVLLLIDYWPLQRWRPFTMSDARTPVAMPLRRLLTEKLPLLACAAASSALTFIAQHRGGAMHGLGKNAFWLNVMNAATSYALYIVKMLWPINLGVFYPFRYDAPLWQAVVAFGGIAVASLLVFRNRRPYLVVGWLWYLATLLPVIGLIRIGGAAMADRYSYIPLVGLFIMIAWALGDFLSERFRPLIAGLFVTALLVLATLTWQQVHYWRNSYTLFEHAIAVTDRNWLAHNHMAALLAQDNRLDEAHYHVSQALRFEQNYESAYVNLGVILLKKGDAVRARDALLRAVELDPSDASAHLNLGIALAATGDRDAAMREYDILLMTDATRAERLRKAIAPIP